MNILSLSNPLEAIIKSYHSSFSKINIDLKSSHPTVLATLSNILRTFPSFRFVQTIHVSFSFDLDRSFIDYSNICETLKAPWTVVNDTTLEFVDNRSVGISKLLESQLFSQKLPMAFSFIACELTSPLPYVPRISFTDTTVSPNLLFQGLSYLYLTDAQPLLSITPSLSCLKDISFCNEIEVYELHPSLSHCTALTSLYIHIPFEDENLQIRTDSLIHLPSLKKLHYYVCDAPDGHTYFPSRFAIQCPQLTHLELAYGFPNLISDDTLLDISSIPHLFSSSTSLTHLVLHNSNKEDTTWILGHTLLEPTLLFVSRTDSKVLVKFDIKNRRFLSLA